MQYLMKTFWGFEYTIILQFSEKIYLEKLVETIRFPSKLFDLMVIVIGASFIIFGVKQF